MLLAVGSLALFSIKCLAKSVPKQNHSFTYISEREMSHNSAQLKTSILNYWILTTWIDDILSIASKRGKSHNQWYKLPNKTRVRLRNINWQKISAKHGKEKETYVLSWVQFKFRILKRLPSKTLNPEEGWNVMSGKPKMSMLVQIAKNIIIKKNFCIQDACYFIQ